MSEPRPSVERTSRTVLVIAAVVGAGLAWIVLSSTESFGWSIPLVPPFTAVAVAVLSVATWLAARWMHRTVQVRRAAVEPARAIALLLAGKAALIGGTALAAGYAVIALRSLPNLDAALPRERAISATVSAVLSVALAVAGSVLERACRVPPDDESGDAPGAEDGESGSPG